MIALLRPPLRLDMPDAIPEDLGSLPRTRAFALLAGVMGFCCFMPYLAVSVGRATSIQLGSPVSLLLLLPFFLRKGNRRGPFWIFPMLMVPLLLATLKAGVTHDNLDLSIKSVPVWTVALASILATQVCAPQYMLELLTGIAIATVLHAAVGALQFYCFSNGEFPLAWMYGNPTFLSVQDNADIIAKYTQRPFGIFPEPSAMSSSLAPWVIFWLAEACGIVRLRRTPARWQRILFVTAAILGLGLIILSRSGHAAITMAGVIVVVALWFVRCKATRATGAAVMVVFGVVMPVTIYFASLSISDRMGGNSDLGNSSWEDRTDSLRIGFQLLVDGDVPTIIFGLGPGLTAPMLARIARLEAVWSVLLTYVYETGVLGALAVCWIGWHLMRTWRAMRFDVTFALMFTVWLVGISLTTSYMELLTLWVALGWLTVWPLICRSSAEREIPTVSHSEIHDGLLQTLMPRIPVLKTPWNPQGWREPEGKLDEVEAPTAAAKTPRLPVKRWSDQ